VRNELVVLLGAKEIGHVRRDPRGRLRFVYDDAWRNAPDAYPLSLSMPLGAKEYGSAAIETFLRGLLPENEFVLARWAAQFHVSARNVFALLSHVGEDCAGAVQFVAPERLDHIKSGKEDKVEWLSEAAIARRLATLRKDDAASRLPSDGGQFSLAGVLPKTALLFHNDRWGIPSGRVPTTHILKPPTGQFDGHAENEHICLMLAHALGLPAAETKVMRFNDEIAIVVARYDRARKGNIVVRLHQEDVCQALGVPPIKKYQYEGGPGALDIIQLLRNYSTDREKDIESLIGALALSWLIAGTGAHAKNFSLLIGARRVRLAPLYDVASILPRKVDMRTAAVALKIGGEYRLGKIGLRQWQKFAREVRVEPDRLIARLAVMAQRLPDEVNAARARARAEGLSASIIERLAAKLIERAGECRRMLGAA
jgi:serine/threonine-protein kinase HipA